MSLNFLYLEIFVYFKHVFFFINQNILKKMRNCLVRNASWGKLAKYVFCRGWKENWRSSGTYYYLYIMLSMSKPHFFLFCRWSNQTSEKHPRCTEDDSLSHFRFRQQQQFRPPAGACRKRKYQSLYCGGHQFLNIFISIDFRSEQRRRLSGGVPDKNRTYGNLLNKRSYNGYNHVLT